ncbi:efflux RND transporter periplasmic adaptor subunit [Rhodopila globiformis]|uniref:Efflux transporter periplasmic adaptor subunit n=1 Tax=Rhodopila globiformis TaxID=1071 RepID=A0A2S6NJR2_RHOGL|nr:efflux RND transporter periplasmic adaptor subunit [Rhodopila globiformis]PPQ35016.1 efflux transporter periplasmic adaptor subunit [Rhodopila globiformis]
MRLFTLIAAVLCPLAILPARAQQPAAVPVEIIVARQQPVTQAAEFVGRIEAVERVEIRARVTGFLQKIDFKEGELVKQGDVLYQIEPDSFQAAVLQARGALFQAQAKFANASVQRARAQELVKTSATSQAELDRQIAAEKAAQGDVITADANLKTASINLNYTTITAPITGEIGRTKVTVGNVVGPDSGPLTTIVSKNPMYVTFPVSQREFLKIQADERRKLEAALSVRIRFSDGSLYPEAGQINFVDVVVDRATDTVTVRATMPNPQGALVDGQLVRVAVQAEKPEEKVLIPQSALIADQQGVYVFLDVDGKAAVQRVKLGGEHGSSVIVNDGLKGGEHVIVQGMETLRPGAPVQATPAPSADRS